MDIGQIVSSVRRAGPLADVRAGGERLAVAVRLLTPLLQNPALTAGGSELARDLRAAVADRAAVTLLLPPGQVNEGTPARIDVGGRQIPIPAALRDALLSALAADSAADTHAATAPSAMPTNATPASAAAAPMSAAVSAAVADLGARAWVVGAQANAAAQVLAATGAARAAVREPGAPPLPAILFEVPLLDPRDSVQSVAAVERLRQQTERSGLFFESHVAQWSQQARSSDALRAEALHLLAAGGNAITGTEAASQRMALQVEVLQRQGFVLSGPAWPGQPVTLQIERELHAHEDGSAGGESERHPVFNAHLRLSLQHLGEVDVHLRLAGDAVATRVAAADPAMVAPALGELAEQMRARGLAPVLTQAVALEAA